MIRKLKDLGARAILVFVIAAGIGFGILAASVAAVLGGLMLIGFKLAQGTAQTTAATAPEPEIAPKGQPA